MNRSKQPCSGPCIARIATRTATSEGIERRPAITSRPPITITSTTLRPAAVSRITVSSALDARSGDELIEVSAGPLETVAALQLFTRVDLDHANPLKELQQQIGEAVSLPAGLPRAAPYPADEPLAWRGCEQENWQ